MPSRWCRQQQPEKRSEDSSAPPVRLAPPITTAEITRSSVRSPALAEALINREASRSRPAPPKRGQDVSEEPYPVDMDSGKSRGFLIAAHVIDLS